MLHSLNSMESCSFNGIDMTVLERQAARMKWVQQQQQNYMVQNNTPTEMCSSSMTQFQGLVQQMVELKEPEAYLGNDDFHKFVNFSVAGGVSGTEYGGSKMNLVAPQSAANYSISRTSSCQLTDFQSSVMKDEGIDMVMEKTEFTTGRESCNKRKAEVVTDNKCKEKRIKGEVEAESEAKTKCTSDVSKNSPEENSDVQKPDYIHVRARRGQATDSHSLAERARREKISKKMKCLQDLVPGCNRITGKAGMLDEIINYVQSLQRQVEFLSMKLAALNSTIEFNVDNLPIKEFPAYMANFPAAAKAPSMANWGCLQLNPLQKEAVNCMLDARIHPAQATTEAIASASGSIPEQAITSSSCINQLQSFSTWNIDPQNLYNLYNMRFH